MAARRMAVPGAPVKRKGRVPDPTTYEVEVHGIGAGGVGIGDLPDGRKVFVPRTAPGDRARIRVLRNRKRWASGEVVSFLARSADRRTPPCPHFSTCDGCSLQHLPYEAQLRWKARIAQEALRRIGRSEVSLPEVVPSPVEFQYRERITFTLRRLPGGRVVAGFRASARRSRVVDVGSDCLLPDPVVARAWRELRQEWGPSARRLPAGRELRLTLRRDGDGAALLLAGGRGPGEAGQLLERVADLRSIWRHRRGKGFEQVAGEGRIRSPGPGPGLELEGGVFTQVNPRVGAELQAFLLQVLGSPRGKKIVDAYCGAGHLGRTLAADGGIVTGIELDPAAVRVARAEGVAGFDIQEGRVEDRLSGALPADAVVLNPPRAGLSPRVPPLLRPEAAPLILYVSCDPHTLARDIRRMAPGYELQGVRCFDLFPQTAHVETIAILRARTGAP